MKKWFAFYIALKSCHIVLSQETIAITKDDFITDQYLKILINKAESPIQFSKGKFSGEGWLKVVSAADKNKYFLLGEDHGFSEIPKFTRELVRVQFYNKFITEIDSVTANVAAKVSRSSNLMADNFHQNHPSSLSFYSAEEEFELLKALNPHIEIIGLDQISLFSTGLILSEMSQMCKNERNKVEILRLMNLSDSLYNQARFSGNYDSLFIFSSTQEQFNDLSYLLDDENHPVKKLFQELKFSWEIYNQINGKNYSSRLEGMKNKFLHCDIKDKDKILLKFGAFHISKDTSLVGFDDIGRIVSSKAYHENESSFHLMIIGKKGTMNTFLPTVGMEVENFSIEDENHNLHFLEPFYENVNESNWSFFDLKDIRETLEKEISQIKDSKLRLLIKGYDALIIIPRVHASTMIK